MRLKENLFSLFAPKEREFKMVWKIEKDGSGGGLLAGTAHFFPYRLRESLESYIRPARTVLLEGPLDEKSMNRVEEFYRALC